MVERIVLVISMALAVWAAQKKALHMFQQNRYEIKRYFAWSREHFAEETHGFIKPWLLLLGVVFLLGWFIPRVTAWVLAVFLCFYAWVRITLSRRLTAIQPLHVTERVKRQIVVLVLLYALFFGLTWHLPLVWFEVLCAAGAFTLPWLLIYLMGWITMPIEAGVHAAYMNKAKKILREREDLIRIGITGSYGKTTTKNIMQAVISERFNSLMTPASYNTPMGITRTIREMLKPIHEVFICEMGADHVGDITELMKFVQPQIGVVTSIGPQHLATFGSQENITHEKMQMIELLPADGMGVLNYDNEFIRNYHLDGHVPVVTYGIDHEDVDFRAVDIVYSQHGSSFYVVHGKERVPMQTRLLGKLNVLNILSAVAVARSLQIPWRTIQAAVNSMAQVEHRLQLKSINGYRFIDDAFNSNPSGSKMALDVLSYMPGQRVIVTPGMIDLGERQAEINKTFGTEMKDKADFVILVGVEQTKPILEGLQESGFDADHIVVLDKEKEAFAYVWSHFSKEDTILLENDLPDAFNH